MKPEFTDPACLYFDLRNRIMVLRQIHNTHTSDINKSRRLGQEGVSLIPFPERHFRETYYQAQRI